MTQEERNNAKLEFCEKMFKFKDKLSYDPIECFDEGVQWADSNPKSPWISVKDDLPCNNHNSIHFGFTNKVLVIDENKNIFISYMKKDKNDRWIWCNDDNFDLLHSITHWMPIPKLYK